MRTFVAVEIDGVVRAELTRLQERLRAAADGVKWVAPELLHLTLKFLGDISDEDAPRAREIVARCAAAAQPFRMLLRGLGAFPNARRPSVIWVGAEDDPPVLGGLQPLLDEAFAELGVPREDRAFRPHLTLGRVRRPAPMPRLSAALDELAGRSFGECPVRELVLMQSELRPSGPVYTPLLRGPLAGVKP